jgi:hypothetical protein
MDWHMFNPENKSESPKDSGDSVFGCSQGIVTFSTLLKTPYGEPLDESIGVVIGEPFKRA